LAFLGDVTGSEFGARFVAKSFLPFDHFVLIYQKLVAAVGADAIKRLFSVLNEGPLQQ
jgi:hypothetical protein